MRFWEWNWKWFRQSIPADSVFSKARLVNSAIIHKDCQIYRFQRTSEMEYASVMKYFHNLFQFVHATGWKALGVEKTVCEVDGTSTDSLRRLTGRSTFRHMGACFLHQYPLRLFRWTYTGMLQQIRQIRLRFSRKSKSLEVIKSRDPTGFPSPS